MSNPKQKTNNRQPVAEAEESAPEAAVDSAAPEHDGESENQLADLKKVIAERDDYLDRLQRSLADFANYKRRTETERTALRQLANRDLLSRIVPILDDLGRALASVPEEQADTSWVKGTALIEKKLSDVLESYGVKAIDALGQPFDPALHEAVATDPGSSGNTVVEVYQTGYRLGDGLLRPAMVRTGDKPAA